ncbi:DNA polymerase III subunit gamma and tau [Schaalia sp. Marseille-Q2122]|uniref:DNA polymerase III subunit gamma and tau n=1 Tax=Schaalia sp. Marseille-Q2122 TaxID=2736604 RepID=UPI00158DF156|nr:DNA polymerase III subunit gamma and tau [Schaalia sp. Marseille-Q2122]
MTTALYRRYRPDSFAHVIGQEHVTDPLRAALRANKVTHAYLFSGPRGCGKTTSARILARCLNCAQGPTDTPCGNCDSCRELATGGPGSLDVVEIDAASHGGVDDARELRERATFAPVRDRYKVFIIDEAHMVTPQGFNALLKLVEEPPEHVKFVFATTEPDRVLGTIRSRTHHYPFRLVPPDALEPYLAQLSTEEGIQVAPGVLNLVIRAGGGSVRDTLSVLDQLMAGTIDGTLAYRQAVALLGYTDAALLDETVDALAGGDGAAVYRVVERMVESGHDPRRFVEDLLQRLRDLLIISVAGDGAADVLSGTPVDQLERMVTQARNWGPRHLSRAADLTDQALRAMVGATSPRLQLELLIGRILVPAAGGHSAAEPALPGTVGMVGGGAPHEATASAGARGGSEAPRFGAAQAREELRRKRQADSVGAQPSTPQSPSPQPSNSQLSGPQTAVQPSAPPTAAPDAAGWADVTAAVPGAGIQAQSPRHEAPAVPAVPASGMQAEPSAPQPTPPAQTSSAPSAPTPTPPAETSPESTATGSDADMLRQRWPEVIERLSSISRVAWALMHENGQLGGVDGTTAVVLLPSEGLVGRFIGGNRGVDVERAIHEATGLQLTVVAQVGQASGGAQVTTPSANASTGATPSSAAPEQSQALRESAPEYAPFERQEASAPADPFRLDPPQAKAPEPFTEDLASASAPHEGEAAPPVSDMQTGWPEAVVPPNGPIEDEAPVAPAVEAEPDPFAPTAPQALAAWSEPVAPIPHSTVAEPAAELKGAASVFGDEIYGDQATGRTSANGGQAHSAGFTRPRLTHVEGGAGAATGESAWAREGSPSAPSVSPVEEGSSVPAQQAPFSPAQESFSTGQSPATPSRPQVSAQEDDSASIDDADVENSQSHGLPAVLEVLGGKVIEEITTEGGW